jgi:hypothetical protein
MSEWMDDYYKKVEEQWQAKNVIKVRDIPSIYPEDCMNFSLFNMDEEFATVVVMSRAFIELFTDEGKSEFADILDWKCRPCSIYGTFSYEVRPEWLGFDSTDEEYDKARDRLTFLTAALGGAISESDWNKWFTEEE